MIRFIAVLLAAALLLGGGLAENVDDGDEWAQEDDVIYWIDYDFEDVYVGNPTHLDGKFFTTLWGNATSDIDVRHLVHGYCLTTWDGDMGMFRIDRSVVSGAVVTENEAGDRTYQFALYEDLLYSDGTPITAWDYAFSVLFQASPVIAELGGLPADLSYLKGCEEYAAGQRDYLEGVRVLGDYLIQFTVRHEYLPYFFEFYRLGFNPYPINEIAPGCKVYDDGQGVYLANEDPRFPTPLFGRELLEETVMNPDFGYLAHPTVGSGPYMFLDFDGETATFQINPYFKGDEDGVTPTIPHLTYTLARNEDMIQLLGDGEFTLLNKVTMADTIHAGLRLAGQQQHQYTMSNYPRIGLTFIWFTPDRAAVQETAVRQAMAYCLERDEVVNAYTGRFGLGMDGLYGLGQWMYGLTNGSLPYPVAMPENPTAQDEKAYEEAIEQWEQVNLSGLTRYGLQTDRAVRLLEAAGWTVNERGEPFDPNRDAFRCKEVDGDILKLDLTCAMPLSETAENALETLFLPNLEKAGIRVTLKPMEMKALLRSYNDRDMEDIDLFYLGDDFNVEFDPSLFFLPGEGALTPDTLPAVHAEMYDLAVEMCRTEPGDVLGFMQKWVRFQERLTQLVPLIPVYSNVYFDFYPRQLHNYQITEYISWATAIVPAYMSDAERLSAEEEDMIEDELEAWEAYFED